MLGEDRAVFGMVALFGLLRRLPTQQLPMVPHSQDCEWRMPHRTRSVLLGGVGGAPMRRLEGHGAPSTCRFALWCWGPAAQHTKIAKYTPWMVEERRLSTII